jgi:hypothetical protein
MSQKSQGDQRKSSSGASEAAQALDSALSSPIVMITSQSGSVYVSNRDRTQWNEHPTPHHGEPKSGQ